MNGIIFNLSFNDIGTTRNSFELDSLIYSWNSSRGELVKKDVLSFPLLAILVKSRSNFPVRLRLYQSLNARENDLLRPPYVSAVHSSGILLDVLLGGNFSAGELKLAPVCLIAGIPQVPITLEKLAPEAVTINLVIELVK